MLLEEDLCVCVHVTEDQSCLKRKFHQFSAVLGCVRFSLCFMKLSFSSSYYCEAEIEFFRDGLSSFKPFVFQVISSFKSSYFLNAIII